MVIEKSPVRDEDEELTVEDALLEEEVKKSPQIDRSFLNADEPANMDELSTTENEYLFKIDRKSPAPVDKSIGVVQQQSFMEKFTPIAEKTLTKVEKQIISPALQETDSALLEAIVSEAPISLDLKLEETAKELSSVKTGTKIADSILQKFNSIKNEMQRKSPELEIEANDSEEKKAFSFELPTEEMKHVTAESELPKEEINDVESKEDDMKLSDIQKKPIMEFSLDIKKKKKGTSKSFSEETDSDSSDSEQLIIARSDDDSQTNSLDVKLGVDFKESDSSNVFMHVQTTDDSQSQEERNFNFDKSGISESPKRESTVELAKTEEVESNIEIAKEEEPDPHLHSLLLCEEEIPRSPAPPPENVIPEETKPKSEMPFASAPGSSCNSKNILLEQSAQKKIVSPVAMEVPLGERTENSTIMDNTPPTTPESTISNLSPRGYV